MSKPYIAANECQSTLSAEYIHGTHTTISLVSAANFPTGGGYVRVGIADAAHWCLLQYTAVSTNDLTGITLCTLGLVETEAAYTYPVGTVVFRDVAGEDIKDANDAIALKIANVVEDTTPQLGGDLDANSNSITGVEKLAFMDPTELTIASDAITTTRSAHYVQPASADADDLATINTPVGTEVLFLRATDANDVITLTETGNILLEGGTTAILPTEGYAMLVYDDVANKWRVIRALGEIVGPASATSGHFFKADGTTGKLAKAEVIADAEVPATIARYTMAAGLTVGDNSILLNKAPADGKWSGFASSFTSHEDFAIGEVGFINADGEMQVCDADAIATAGGIGIATAAISSGNAGVFLLFGYLHLTGASWTVGAKLYLNETATASIPTATLVTGSAGVSQILGVAVAADVILFYGNLAMAVIT
jgi:hypothetical protein